MLSAGAGRHRGVHGSVFKAHRLCVSLNSRFESNTEEEEDVHALNLTAVERTSHM